MPRMKVDISDQDLTELEEAEYDEGGQYESYDGEQPPVGTELAGFIKKIWWTYSQNDDDMLKILFVADGNEGTDEEEFEGCPIWENYSLISTMKFKWDPFLDALGLTIRDVIRKTHVEEEEDGKNGQPVIKIGTWEPGSDQSYCRVITDRHKFDGNWQTDVGTWLPYEDEDAEPEPEPEPEPARPTARSSRSKSSADGAGTTSRSGRRTRKAEPEEPEDPEDGEENVEAEESAPPARGRARAGRPSRAPGGARAAKPAARGRGGRRSSGGNGGDEPPF